MIWIKCKDKYPPQGEPVLVQVHGKHKIVYMFGSSWVDYLDDGLSISQAKICNAASGIITRWTYLNVELKED